MTLKTFLDGDTASMTMEMDVTHSSHQDMNLIDILWEQDIDLGARREVFDFNHRQKEHEHQRQLELQEQKRLHLLREKEKALLAQLQLDEETGEYIPRPPPSGPLRPPAEPLQIVQDVSFTDGSGNPMSFDECLQLLAETFPVDEPEQNSPTCLDTNVVSMMSPEQPAVPPAALTPPTQTMSPDLEQTWMEILSLPELQNCLNLPVDDSLENSTYPLTNSPEEQSPNYTFYNMSSLSEGETPTTADVNVCPDEFMNTFDGSVPGVVPAPEPDDLGQDAECFGDLFYAGADLEENVGRRSPDGTDSDASRPTLAPADLYSLSPGDAFDQGELAELPESDSGISSHTSPNASSPGKSVSGDGSCHYSDSDMEEMEQNPGSAVSVYSEMFSLDFQPDDLQQTVPESALLLLPPLEAPEAKLAAPVERGGSGDAPFTKDKLKRRSDTRLSRDEARAKALKIPLSVDMIINLPVDDFNEVMSKHQLSEAQLALVRDIRRRGKNKVAAQNCRKRKMENIVGLEGELDALQEERQQLLADKRRNATALRQMKRQLSSLYMEVFASLRDENGRAYSPAEYSLQQSTNGSVFLVPRVRKAPPLKRQAGTSLANAKPAH